MLRSHKSRPALVAGWACLASLLPMGFATAAESKDASQLLEQADNIKTSNHTGFLQALKQLDGDTATLSARQQLSLRYLHAWQNVYDGEYEAGEAGECEPYPPWQRHRFSKAPVRFTAAR